MAKVTPNKLRALRVEKNVKQADLAAKLGISQQDLSDLEVGRRNDSETLCKAYETLRAMSAQPRTPRTRRAA